MTLIGAINYKDDNLFLKDLYDFDQRKADQMCDSYDDAGWFERAIWNEIETKGLLTPALGRLDQLHLRLQAGSMELDGTQINGFSSCFYETSEKFMDLYRSFVSEVVVCNIGEPCFYQRIPTIRFHFPDEEGFGEQPIWHADIMIGHPPNEMNVWVPITDALEGNSIRIMHRMPSLELMEACQYDFTDFNGRYHAECMAKSRPMLLTRGHYLLFDPRCIHATQKNVTDKTRVSLDFRVIPVRAFDKLFRGYKGGGRKPQPFSPGGYYATEVIG